MGKTASRARLKKPNKRSLRLISYRIQPGGEIIQIATVRIARIAGIARIDDCGGVACKSSIPAIMAILAMMHCYLTPPT
jgi:hypothetical protein